jgi:single-stranded DNA-binding protein
MNELRLAGRIYSIKAIETKTGKAMVAYTVTTYTKQGEDKEDKAQFHNCVSYGNTAENILNNIKDRDSVIVFGYVDHYKDKNEVQRTQMIINRAYNTIVPAKEA